MTRRTTPRPFPMGTLLTHCHLSLDQAADRLGLTRRQICRWKRIGLTATQADELAVRLRRHPNEVWTNYDNEEDPQ